MNPSNPLKRLPYKLLLVLFFVSFLSVLVVKSEMKKVVYNHCENLVASFLQSIEDNYVSDIEAKTYFVYDFTRKAQISARNENEIRPLASLAKLMSARIALLNEDLNKTIVFSSLDLNYSGDQGIFPGDEIEKSKLLKLALVSSSNDAIESIAVYSSSGYEDFISKMNGEAKRIDLISLSFKNASGLDEPTIPTALGSASDVTKLLYANHLEFPQVFGSTSEKESKIFTANGREIKFVNTNKEIDSFPILIAGKTGYTNFAGGNLSILFIAQNGDTIGATVLGSMQNDRFIDMEKIHKMTSVYLNNIEYLPKICSK